MRSVLWLVLLAGCAGRTARPRALDVAPRLVVDSPTADLLVHDPEIEVRGRLTVEGNHPSVWVSGVKATIGGDRFEAKRVPLGEGKTFIAVDLDDGHGKKTRVTVPLVVETHDRPRSAKLCDSGACVPYETRGTPKRDAQGRITNAIVVLSAFGFDEKLDELWPDLVGPGRALDSRRAFIVGVAPTVEPLVYALFSQLGLDTGSPIVGASSYGGELALRLLAHEPRLTGPVLVCGGHDRAYLEPAVKRIYSSSVVDGSEPLQKWRDIASVMVQASYTRAYLADRAHAVDHGLVPGSFPDALTELAAEHYLHMLGSVTALHDRLAATMALERTPLVFQRDLGSPQIVGRLVVLVANRLDAFISIENVEALAKRLRSAGARVELQTLSDPLGHSVFFRRAPAELERGVAILLGGAS